ncbi:MAG TPA: SRPBCC family protein [Pyrinomonadaceae bacterium]|jgi:uncharacterized protein YndB with AHSA1/START domain
MHIVEKRMEIRAPVERVFDLFSDFESFPRWMKNIKEVRYTGRRYTRWAAEAPLGTEVEWEAETTHFEPDHRIAWRSVRGDVDTEGEVVFEETRRGTTLMRVVLGYALPAGRLGEMVARLFGKDPERQLEDDLERFAAVAEGRRRSARRDEMERERKERPRRAARDESHIGPRERRPRDAEDDEQKARFAERRDYPVRERRARDYYADDNQRSSYREEPPQRERESRARFEEALRDARRSQLEGQRRYAAERARSERERNDEPRYREERESRQQWEDDRRERNERREESRRRELDTRYDEEDESRLRQRRHALTPRERQTERDRGRDPDYGYSEQAFRRGVEKLMDEPPSRRWRRWE